MRDGKELGEQRVGSWRKTSEDLDVIGVENMRILKLSLDVIRSFSHRRFSFIPQSVLLRLAFCLEGILHRVFQAENFIWRIIFYVNSNVMLTIVV
jgi:hypothetical protein